MTDVADFIVVDVPSMLQQVVTFGLDGPRDHQWNVEAATTQFIFAEFLAEHDLLAAGVSAARRPELTIRWLQLTERGQTFTRAHFHKWLRSVDSSGTPAKMMREKLDRRWKKFTATQPTQ